MTYHTIMKENADYIGGLREARSIGDNITKTIQSKMNTNATVFPYRYVPHRIVLSSASLFTWGNHTMVIWKCQ